MQSPAAASNVDHERGDRNADHIRVDAHEVKVAAKDVACDDDGQGDAGILAPM